VVAFRHNNLRLNCGIPVKRVLDTGDTLRGLIKYDLDKDIIQLQANNKLESYTARKVLLFEIFDETVKRYRNFYSLPYALAGQYKAPVFFELLQEGKLTVLCREHWNTEPLVTALLFLR
jgi:hypothetical protein